jgi:transcriptional regulator with XRE-family HTH domain
MKGDVRFVFDSLTGMQELWGGEEHIQKFYSHSCPRLYDLNTIAYWIVEKAAHSQMLRAHINKIAQVAIDLSVKRGKTVLTILKAEKREHDTLNKPYSYWSKGHDLTFESEKRVKGGIGVGKRIKELRTKRGFSQTELAKLVGVTPSTISQVESDLIHPSLPALFKIAEVLAVEMKSFFQESGNIKEHIVFHNSEAVEVTPKDFPSNNIKAKLLTPLDFGPRAEPYLIEIPPGEEISNHFFVHKGEEFGYLLSGELILRQEKADHIINPGDVVYLTSEIPAKWKNPGKGVSVLLWLKIR